MCMNRDPTTIGCLLKLILQQKTLSLPETIPVKSNELKLWKWKTGQRKNQLNCNSVKIVK